MPSATVTMPDGRSATVTWPEGTKTEAEVFDILKNYKPEFTAAETAVDVGKGLLRGLGKTATGTLGLPRVAQDVVGAGAAAVGAPEPSVRAEALPSGEEFQQMAERITGPWGEARTPPGRVAETLGEMAPAALSPGSVLSRTAAVVGGTAGSEFMGGATRGMPYEPLARGVGSLAAGGGLASLARAGQRAASPMAGAAADLARALQRDGDTAVAINARLAQIRTVRPNATIVDVAGENVRGLLERVAQTPGAGRTIVIPAIETKQKGQLGRIEADLKLLTGTERSAFEAIKAVQAEREAAAAPWYKQAFDFNARENPEIMRAWQKETATGFGEDILHSPKLRKMLQTEYGISDPGQAPMMVIIDAWKKAVDGEVGKLISSGDKTLAGVLIRMNRRVTDVLDKHNPAYAKARSIWHGSEQYEEAIKEGKGFLDVGAEELRARMGEMTEVQREAYRIGAVSKIVAQMGRNTAELPDFTKMLRSREMREKIAAIMPTQEAAEAWASGLDYEVGVTAQTNRAMRGSRTPRVLAEQEDAKNIVSDLVVSAVMSGPSHHLFWRMLESVRSPIRDTLRSRVDEKLGGMLTSPQLGPVTIPDVSRSGLIPRAGALAVGGAAGAQSPLSP